MKNNQFKKEVRKIIEKECKILSFQSVYIDENKNSRKIYIYNKDWRFAGMFSCLPMRVFICSSLIWKQCL